MSRTISESVKQNINRLYRDELQSIPEIAASVGISVGAVHKHLNEPCRTISEGISLKWNDQEFRANQVAKRQGKPTWNKGKKYNLNKVVQRPNLRGNKSHFWKGGKTALIKLLRGTGEYREWRKQVFTRDSFTCVLCDRKRKRGDRVLLHADHIIPFAILLRQLKITTLEKAKTCMALWEVSNGRTLCEVCHKQTDTWLNGTQRALKEMEL